MRVSRRDKQRDSHSNSESDTSRFLSRSLQRHITTEPHDHKISPCERSRLNTSVGQTYQTIRVYAPPTAPRGHRSRSFRRTVFSYRSLTLRHHLTLTFALDKQNERGFYFLFIALCLSLPTLPLSPLLPLSNCLSLPSVSSPPSLPSSLLFLSSPSVSSSSLSSQCVLLLR